MHNILLLYLFLVSSSLLAESTFRQFLRYGCQINLTNVNGSHGDSFDEHLAVLTYQTFNQYLNFDSLKYAPIERQDNYEDELLNNGTLNLVLGYAFRNTDQFIALDYLQAAYDIFDKQKDTLGQIFSLRTANNIFYEKKALVTYINDGPFLSTTNKILTLTENSTKLIYSFVYYETLILQSLEPDESISPSILNYYEESFITDLKSFPEFYFLRYDDLEALRLYFHFKSDYNKELELSLAKLKYCHENIRKKCLIDVVSSAANTVDTKVLEKHLNILADEYEPSELENEFKYYRGLSRYYFYTERNDLAVKYLQRCNAIKYDERKDYEEKLSSVIIKKTVDSQVEEARLSYQQDLKRAFYWMLFLLAFISSVLFLLFKIYRVNKLNELLYIKEQMAGVLSHDIRAPLLSLIAKLDLSSTKAISKSNDALELNETKQILIGMNNLCNDTIEFVKKNKEADTTVEIDSEKLIRFFVRDNLSYYKLTSTDVSVSLEKIGIYLSAYQILSVQIILRNLISNIIKHSKVDQILISNSIENRKFTIRLDFEGFTFDKDELAFLNKLFKKNSEVISGYGSILVKNFMTDLKQCQIDYSNKNNVGSVAFSWYT